MSDLISRQAAIDALRVAYWDDKIQSAKDDPCIVDAMTDWAIRQVKALPSAQQERTCVNCGRTANNVGWYADGRTRCPIEEHYALPKDGYCHLWEKRNVTDDDYPERREE